MATWVVGDIHGCASELDRLVRDLELAQGDRLVSVGDLFHRGPDPSGVLDILAREGALFLLGNHEHAVLARAGLAPARADGSDRPALRTEFPPLTGDDLAGDGRRALAAPAERLADFLVFLQRHSGYYLTLEDLPGAGPTPDGRSWRVVHAGLVAGRALAEHRPVELVTPQRSGLLRKAFWFETWTGPELALYGHLPGAEPARRTYGGRLVALGLDTGCVYGGRLSAYSPELDRLVSVPAQRAYARP
jgi:hypothetical protein